MKWQRTLMAMTLVGVLALGLYDIARADDTSMGAVGSAVVPLQNDQVTMTAEQVDAVIRSDQAWVTCVFTFTNSGPPATVLKGFPQMTSERVGTAPELLDFGSEVDGKAVAVSFRKQATSGSGQSEYAGWYTFNVPFGANETHSV